MNNINLQQKSVIKTIDYDFWVTGELWNVVVWGNKTVTF